jgi:hypothetical protein
MTRRGAPCPARLAPGLVALLLALPLPSGADEGVHLALVGGAGLAQGVLGVDAQLRQGHLAVFAGSGLVFGVTLDGDSLGGPGYGGSGPRLGALTLGYLRPPQLLSGTGGTAPSGVTSCA